ncbi:MAG: ABC transporter ATP-binding protein [Burkholderiales bacterium]|nr:ABC transporter ATP-binding protein [Phycisphaerae bacterium]
MSNPVQTTPPRIAELPANLTKSLNGELGGQEVLAWSEFDLNQSNKIEQSYAVLTSASLIRVAEGRKTVVAVGEITEAKIHEGLGMDRLVVKSAGEQFDLRYSRKFRRDAVRLHRHLARLLPDQEGKPKEDRPAWLEQIERQAEQQEKCPKCGTFIPAYAERVCPKCSQSRTILWRLLDVARDYRGMLAFALGLTFIQAGFLALTGMVNRHLIDDAIVNSVNTVAERMASLRFWALIFAAVIVAGELVGWGRGSILTNVGRLITRDLRHRVYAHMHSLSLRFFAKRRSGSLITRVTNDTDRLWDFIVFGSVDVVRDALIIIVSVSMMFWMNWRLALIALSPLPFIAIITWWRGKTMHRLFGRLWTYWSRMSAVVGDATGGVRVVKAFAAEQREIARFEKRNQQYAEKELEVNRMWVRMQPLVSTIMRMSMLLIWVVGGYFLITDPSPANSIGTLTAFTFYVGMFFGPINSIANSARMVTRAASSAQRVFEVLDTPPEVYTRAGAFKKDSLEGRIEFRNVGFSYEGAQPAMRDVSITIEPGMMIGLCGHSGAGKSTFVNLICRFYDVTEGQILIDGVDLRDYDVHWIRQQIGVVLQEPYLFHGTISDNIRYGRPDASDMEVIEAARAANAHDFIVGFPDGYDTMVGERGQSLSGGERQRISIARAILHNPKILVLDEATSSLDTETERQIQEAMNRLVTGRTTIAIAHRLSTLRAADRLVVLDKGRIAEEGTHDELYDKPDGVYAKLYKTQMEMNQQIGIK